MKIQLTALSLALLFPGVAALGASAAIAQTELFFATGVDSTGWAQAQSNADGHVLIESPQYPRGLWLHLVNEAGDALAGLQVEYQGQPDSLVVLHCVDPTGDVQETLVWTRPEGTPLRLMLKPKEAVDLPTGLASIDWRIDPTSEVLLEPEEVPRLSGWEAVVAFLQARWQGQTGRIAVQLDANTLAVEVNHPEDIEMLVAHLQQAQQPVATSLGEISPLKMQVFTGSLGLREGVILFNVPLFEDSNLERAVRQALGRPQGRLTPEALSSLTELKARDENIRSLSGVEYLTDLWVLDLLWNNQIADVTPISNLTNLRSLNLGSNQIIDVTPLANLNNLETLWLWGNQIADVTPLANLTDSQYLHLQNNQIIDVTPLTNLTNLQWLTLDSNQIADINSLVNLANLRGLGLSNNRIKDITPLVANTGLGEGDMVDLKGNPLSDQALNEQIPALKSRGVTVYY